MLQLKQANKISHTYDKTFDSLSKVSLPPSRVRRWMPGIKYNKVICASSLQPMESIAIDTIYPVDDDMSLKYIIVIIDTFSRYVELFPKQELSAMATADALWRRHKAST